VFDVHPRLSPLKRREEPFHVLGCKARRGPAFCRENRGCDSLSLLRKAAVELDEPPKTHRARQDAMHRMPRYRSASVNERPTVCSSSTLSGEVTPSPAADSSLSSSRRNTRAHAERDRPALAASATRRPSAGRRPRIGRKRLDRLYLRAANHAARLVLIVRTASGSALIGTTTTSTMAICAQHPVGGIPPSLSRYDATDLAQQHH
jgi:hypothetical protein